MLLEVVRLEEIAPVVGAELIALIGMDDDGLLRLPAPNSHQQGVQGQFTIHSRPGRPSDDLT